MWTALPRRRAGAFFGFLIAVASLCPLLGSFYRVPSLAIGGLLTIVATAVLPFLSRPRFKDGAPRLIVLLFLFYVASVLAVASPDQWDFFFSPTHWPHHENDYVRSKLTTFLVTSLPAAYLAILFVTFGYSRRTFQGFAIGAIVVGLAAALRATIDGYSLLAGTDHLTSREFFLAPKPYSTVGFGILFVLAAIFSTTQRKLWPLAGVFLLMCLWLDRKAETIIILAIVSGLLIFAERRGKRRILVPIAKIAAVIAITSALFVPLHNESNVQTWVYIQTNIAHRVAILGNQAWDSGRDKLIEPPKQRIASAVPDEDVKDDASPQPVIKSEPGTPATGLGSFALNSTNRDIRWPHNILYEAYIETGTMSAIALLAIALIGVVTALRSADKTKDVTYLSLAAAATAVFLISLKSGDITNVGRIVFFSLIATWTTQPRTRPPTNEGLWPAKT